MQVQQAPQSAIRRYVLRHRCRLVAPRNRVRRQLQQLLVRQLPYGFGVKVQYVGGRNACAGSAGVQGGQWRRGQDAGCLKGGSLGSVHGTVGKVGRAVA